MNDEMVESHIQAMIVGGYDTSALTRSYVIILLAMHPSIQERLYNELRSIFDEQDENTTYEHIHQLEYLDLVIKETIRLFPVVPFVIRSITGDIPLNKCTVPKDAYILVSLYHLHRVFTLNDISF